MVFAVCGIAGALYGMGKTPAYLSHRPDDARRGLLVGVHNTRIFWCRACWLLWSIVLVARTDILRIYLHYCQTIYCHHPSSSYDPAHPFVGSLRYYGDFDRGGDRLSFLHNLPVSPSRTLLESIISERPLPWHKHSSWYRLYVQWGGGSMRFHHWLLTYFHGLEASNEAWYEIRRVGNFGTCLYVRMLHFPSYPRAYSDDEQS